ncbi:MAG: hypothetical protein RSA84_17750, partial [Acinetobacter sp.]
MEVYLGFFIFTVLLVGSVSGCFCFAVAKSKDRSGGLWFILGVVFNVIALIAIAGMPKNVYNRRTVTCRYCDEQISKYAT